MADCASRSLDFAIRIVQLARWLKDEGKDFPLVGRLLESGAGLGVCVRTAKALGGEDGYAQALRHAEEIQFHLELMVNTGFITQLQSGPLLAQCRSLKKEIGSLLSTTN